MRKTHKTSKRGTTKLAIARETVRELTASDLMHVEGGSTTHQGSSLHINTGGTVVTAPTVTR